MDAVQSGTGLSFDAQGMQKFKEGHRPGSVSDVPPAPMSGRPINRLRGQNLRESLGSSPHATAQGFSLQEMDDDDILPAEPLAPDPVTQSLRRSSSDRALPTPPRPSNSPEHEWLDMLGGHGVGGGGGVDPILGKLEPRVGVGGPLSRSASQDDEWAQDEGSAAPSSLISMPGSRPEPREADASRVPGADELGGDWGHGQGHEHQPALDDEFARRVREIKS